VPNEQKWSGDESPGSADGSLPASGELELGDFSEGEGLEDDEETGLTRQARNQRRERKRQNTLLDHRIVSDSKITKEEKTEAYQDMIKRMAINGVLIGLW
jgi:solute carrier family 35 protein C2